MPFGAIVRLVASGEVTHPRSVQYIRPCENQFLINNYSRRYPQSCVSMREFGRA